MYRIALWTINEKLYSKNKSLEIHDSVQKILLILIAIFNIIQQNCLLASEYFLEK